MFSKLKALLFTPRIPIDFKPTPVEDLRKPWWLNHEEEADDFGDSVTKPVHKLQTEDWVPQDKLVGLYDPTLTRKYPVKHHEVLRKTVDVAGSSGNPKIPSKPDSESVVDCKVVGTTPAQSGVMDANSSSSTLPPRFHVTAGTYSIDAPTHREEHGKVTPREVHDVLNVEQQRVFDFISSSGRNIFVTGRAGSGKTYLLRYLLRNTPVRHLPVAYMGVAALNMGGATIHSQFKLPLHLLVPSTGRKIAERLSEEERLFYRTYKMLVVDEVSMVAADQFQAMDEFLRTVNENEEPFGGVQVVLFGDPYQLPPVIEKNSGAEFYGDLWGDVHFFSTESWLLGNFLKVELQGSERQSDHEFLEILDSMRMGNLSNAELAMLNSRVVTEQNMPRDGVIRVSPTNAVAEKYNALRMNQLSGDSFVFVGEAKGEYRKNWNRLPAPLRLHLKQDAQIILVKNDQRRRWVNGSIGSIAEVNESKIVVEIDGLYHQVNEVTWDKESHTYNRANKSLVSDVFSEYRQYPIDLGWARTIHKSQGQTFEKCVVDLAAKMFANGQAYVACSRSKELGGLYLTSPLKKSDVMVSNSVRQFMSGLLTPEDLTPFL